MHKIRNGMGGVRVLLAVTLIVSGLVAALAVRPAQAAAGGLVAAYSFEAGSGTTLADVSGENNTGTISGATWSTSGKNGKALSFDGVNDYVQMADSNSLDLTNGITLEAWVRPTTNTGWRTVAFKHQPGHMTYALYGSTNTNRPSGQVYVGGERDVRGTTQLANNTWTHLTTTYDGANQRLYVNGVQVASRAQTGNASTSTGVLRLGGNSLWSEWYGGLIDDVRIYNRALSASEIQTDMNTPVSPPVTDTQAPTTPSGLTLTAITESSATLSWSASSDNVGVTGYGLYRGMVPSGSSSTTSTNLTGLSCGTTYLLGVDAYDASGNRSAQATTSLTTAACDTVAPTVIMTSPAGNTTVNGAVAVSANAGDNKGVVGVQFKLNGANLGAEDTVAPYSVNWDTTTGINGNFTLTAVARDSSGNQATATPVTVTVNNQTPQFVNNQLIIGLNEPVAMTFTPDGRMLVVERGGRIWVAPPGATQVNAMPFLQLSTVWTTEERGMLGITLDPNFATNSYYYVFYTHTDQKNRVSRFTASGNGTVPGSEQMVWQSDLVSDIWHQGGDLTFGPDGYLYISVGDHMHPETAQSLTTMNGKILRIAKDGTIPTDNPFYDGAGPNKDAIWARGLRNPFRFTIDSVTGRMFIGDVGQGAWEEVNLGAKGANYGWQTCEGVCNTAGLTDPLYTYPHSAGEASVTGGFVYRGSQFPAEYQGDYFFGDYAMNWIKRLDFDAAGNYLGVKNFEPANGANHGPYGAVVGFAPGPDGSLWYVDAGPFAQNNAGSIRRIKNLNANQPPTAQIQASATTGPAPLTVNFTSTGSSDPEGQPLSYQWDFGNGAVSTQANPSYTYTQSGRYTVRLTTSEGTNQTPSTPLTITVGNPPTAQILTPSNNATFRAGDLISWTGQATDPEDGALPASALSWKMVFHHEGHIHPAGDTVVGASGSYQIPTSGHSYAGNTWYEIVLTATDADGIQSSTSVGVYPEKVNLDFTSTPAGLTIMIDGLNYTTPFTYDTLVGFQHNISAPSPQFVGGNRYAYAGWSDGGAQTHGVTVPTTNQSYAASFNLDNAAPAGLVAAYNFNEGNGGTLYDYSPNGSHGTLSGPIWSAGKNGGALLFDGVNDSVGIPDSNTLDLTTGMTLEAWVNPNVLSGGGGWRTVLFKHQTSHMTYSLYANTDTNRPTGQVFVGAERDNRGSTMLPLNTWTHLTSTYDGTTLRLYVNGTQVSSLAVSGSMTVSGGSLKIGGNDVWGEWYSGLIDDVRIYNRALTPTEIQGDMGTPVN